MPVTYVIDTQEKVIRTQCVGMSTLAEVVDHFRALERDPECVGHLDVLLDLTEMKSLPNARQIQAVPYEIARIREKVRFGACAIVATTDPLFGMLRMFEVLAERFFRVIHVFRTKAEAETWLASERQQSSQVDGGSISEGIRSEADKA
ncbi:MAG: hypothetical protein WB799_24030 [Candidatus Sulfotelmatobacter sp.]